jgi:hypothetical protein
MHRAGRFTSRGRSDRKRGEPISSKGDEVMLHISAKHCSKTSARIVPKNILVFSLMLTLAGLCMASGCAKATDAESARKEELAAVLTSFLRVPPPPADPDEASNDNPGWYDPANRQALRDFIAKYPDTEEGYQAGVWLVFARSITEINQGLSLSEIDRTDRAKAREKLISFEVERKHRRAEFAEELNRIISKTTRPATAKMGKILRAGQLLQADDYSEFEKQAYDILNHAKEYETEKDEPFMRFTQIDKTPAWETEPIFRQLLIVSECLQHHFDKALVLAKELKEKFPKWSKHERIDGNIEMLEHGMSPFPTREDMMARGRAWSNDTARPAPTR